MPLKPSKSPSENHINDPIKDETYSGLSSSLTQKSVKTMQRHIMSDTETNSDFENRKKSFKATPDNQSPKRKSVRDVVESEIDNVQNSITSAQNAIIGIEEEITSTRNAIIRIGKEISVTLQRMSPTNMTLSTSDEYQSINKHLETLKEERESLKKEMQTLKKERESLKKEMQTLEKKMETIENRDKTKETPRTVASFNMKDSIEEYIHNMSQKIIELNEGLKDFPIDRAIQWAPKFYVADFVKDDLRLQNMNIETEIQNQINQFLEQNRTHNLAVLIGPTGCGKTHAMFEAAKTRFAVFIDATHLSRSGPVDKSLSEFKDKLHKKTVSWNDVNQDLLGCSAIAIAFIMSRILFFRILKKRFRNLTPFQFLIYQLKQSYLISEIFLHLLASYTEDELLSYNVSTLMEKDLNLLWCVDEAQVLREHLGDQIISEMKTQHRVDNKNVLESSKRGSLSMILKALWQKISDPKIIFAGTARQLRYIDNFGTNQTKPNAPLTIENFKPWTPEQSIHYVSTLLQLNDEATSILKTILFDNYRPRILENFIYDLLKMASNDTESPTIAYQRTMSKNDLKDLNEIFQESYKAVINRFDRSVLKEIEIRMKKTDPGIFSKMIRLLFSSMISTQNNSIYFKFSELDFSYFMDTVGSIYPVLGYNGMVCGFSLEEGYVINGLIQRFKNEIEQFQLNESLKLLQTIIGLEGKKSAAKGAPFESVCLFELSRPEKNWTIGSFCTALNVSLDEIAPEICEQKLPAQLSTENEEGFLKKRPKLWLRPSNKMRPDGIGFPANDTMVTIGIKLHTSTVKTAICNDNLLTTDSKHFLQEKPNGTFFDPLKRKTWDDEMNPIRFTLRLHFIFPKASKNFSLPKNTDKEINVLVTLENVNAIFSKPTCDLLRFICESEVDESE